MEFFKKIILKDGRECTLRHCTGQDGEAVLEIFRLTHEQTDFLLSYPDETFMNAEREAEYLRKKADSANEIEIIAEVGVSIDRAYWGLGIGRALTEACVACARKAGYAQIELDVVAENRSAIALYESVGFTEYGRNPRGFRSRLTGWQELVLMRMELD